MCPCFHEVVSTIRFDKDIPMRGVQSGLAGLISNSLLFHEQLKEMHGFLTVEYPMEF